MNPLMVLAILAEAAKLTSIISERLARGKITPEEALEQWEASTARWNRAAFAWRNTPAPSTTDGAGYTTPSTT